MQYTLSQLNAESGPVKAVVPFEAKLSHMRRLPSVSLTGPRYSTPTTSRTALSSSLHVRTTELSLATVAGELPSTGHDRSLNCMLIVREPEAGIAPNVQLALLNRCAHCIQQVHRSPTSIIGPPQRDQQTVLFPFIPNANTAESRDMKPTHTGLGK